MICRLLDREGPRVEPGRFSVKLLPNGALAAICDNCGAPLRSFRHPGAFYRMLAAHSCTTFARRYSIHTPRTNRALRSFQDPRRRR
jgi:hypothetical protein